MPFFFAPPPLFPLLLVVGHRESAPLAVISQRFEREEIFPGRKKNKMEEIGRAPNRLAQAEAQRGREGGRKQGNKRFPSANIAPAQPRTTAGARALRAPRPPNRLDSIESGRAPCRLPRNYGRLLCHLTGPRADEPSLTLHAHALLVRHLLRKAEVDRAREKRQWSKARCYSR